MPYPMIKKDVKEKWEKSIENSIGLPIDLIRRLDTYTMSFYLQNKSNMTVKQSGNEIFFFVSDKGLKDNIYKTLYGNKVKCEREAVFDEDSFDKYLAMICYAPEIDKEYRIDGIPSSRFLNSDKINRLLD